MSRRRGAGEADGKRAGTGTRPYIGAVAAVVAIVLMACVASAEEWTEMRVPSGAGTVDQRVGQLERRSSGMLRFLSDDAGDSARIVDDFLRPGQELWHTADDGTLWIVRVDIDGTVLAVRALYVETDPVFVAWEDTVVYVRTETDPVFVAWKPTYVVVGATDTSLVRVGGVQKTVRINPAFTNTFSAIQNFAQGLTTEYRSNELGAAPGSADLNTAFGSSLADGYPGFFYEITGDVLYLVARGNSGWWRLPMTKVP